MTTELGPVLKEETSTNVKSISARRTGKFYVFEGIDGSGKTTVSRRLFEKISQESHREVVLTAEPTDCWLGDAVRKSYDEDVSPFTEALLFMADRADHTDHIKDWLSKGIIVLCDRYNASTLAYQGAIIQESMGDSALEWLKAVSKMVIIEPDITFLFSISPETALLRLNERDEISKFEKLGYLMDVDAIYRKVADEDPSFFVIDASAPLDDVVEEVLRAIKADLQ